MIFATARLEKNVHRIAMGVAVLVALGIPTIFLLLEHYPFELTSALSPVGNGVLIRAMFSFGLGALVYFGMKWLPLRALRAATEAQQRAEASLRASLQDVAEREAAERRLKQLNEELEQRVAQRTAEMRAAMETAEHANAAKSAFLANMSHEIRTPIGAVMGLARIGMRENAGRKTEKTCDQILEAGKHLLGVVNDILDFSKIEAGKLAIDARSFHLAHAVEHAVGLVADRAQAKDLLLAVDYVAVPSTADFAQPAGCAGAEQCSAKPPLRPAPTFVIGDPLRLGQILMNLLGNAIKFTEAGEVRLSIGREGNVSFFRVADTGPGMTPELMARLFNPFEQADNTLTRKFGGTGLGLTISRNLALLMGGDIMVDSRAGEGSVFTLWLPLPEGEAVEEIVASPSASSGPYLTGLRILAAEDLEINRLILDDLMDNQGATIVWAHDGQQAVDAVESKGAAAFDIVLMDVQMPVMNGYEATSRIRALAPQLPVIGLTAHAMPEEQERCLAAGMVAHLTKPIDPDALLSTILAHVATQPTVPLDSVASAKPPVAANAFGSSSVIDRDKLLARYHHRQSFIDKLLATILSSHVDSPVKLRAAAADGDVETIRFIAHALKGIGGSIESARLIAQAVATESSVKAGAADVVQQALALADLTDSVLALLGQPLMPA